MKIRTQNMLAIMPLFLGLAVLIGALMYIVQYRELIWGLDEETTSIAVATARHLDAEQVRALEDESTAPSFLDAARAVLDWDKARRMAVLSPQMQVLFDSAEDPAQARPIALPPAQRARLDNEPYVSTSVEQDARGRYVMAFSPVRDDDGVAAIVMVETDADVLTAHEQRIRRNVQGLIVVAALIGVGIALLISRIISRRIDRLTRMASAIGEGHYEQADETGGIQEIQDLSRTFNTMSSVLSEVVSRTRRAVVEAEQFRTDDDLARAFVDTFMPAEHRQVQGVELSAVNMSSRSSGHFFGIWEKQQHVMAVVGEIDAEPGLRAPLNASAAASLLREYWKTRDMEAACTAWGNLFNIRSAHALTWDADSDGITHCRWDSDRATFVTQNSTWTDAPVVLHTIPEQESHRIRLYVSTYAHLTPKELTQEIRLTLNKDQQGAIIVLKRS